MTGGMAGDRRNFKQRAEVAWEPPADFEHPQAGQGLLGTLSDKLRQVPRYVSFSNFRRGKERQQQGAPVFETTRARGKKLAAAATSGRSYRSSTPCDDDEDLMRSACLSRCSNGTSASDNNYTVSTRAPSTEPGSRPSTRQGMRSDNFEGVMEIQRQEVGDDKFVDIVLREQRKQEYWDDYTDAASPKKVSSDFEEYMRRLHEEAGDEEILDSDLVSSTVGFTRRTPREELISSYAKQCRETYSVPLGPRRCVPGIDPNEDACAAQLASPELLNYSGWSLGSERLNVLCNTSGKGMRNCRHCDLSGNRISHKSVQLLCDQLLPTVETLNLSQNELGRHGALALAQGFKFSLRPPLLELNLENNRLGEAHEKEVCDFVESLETHCPLLRGLSLAQNQLGKVEAALGRAIGHMVASMLQLKVLDLHWNHFHGLGAYHLLMGVYDNGQHGGCLSRLDLAWNRLGKVDDSYRNAVPAKVLADILEDHKKVFHLDVSYNHMNEEACGYLASSIRGNHTLFGLHISGNDATIDERGFLVPRKLPAVQRSGDLIDTSKLSFLHQRSRKPKRQNQAQGALQRRRVSASGMASTRSARSLCNARRKMKMVMALAHSGSTHEDPDQAYPHALDLSAEIGSHPLDSIHLRAEHCWICDRWRQVMLTWTPGVSGSLPDAEVFAVFAFISLDNFKRPILLHRKMKHHHKQNAVRWEGYCMVPPPSADVLPLLVLFQVNHALEFAQDMTVRVLSDSVEMCPVDPDAPHEGEMQRLGACRVVAANEIPTNTDRAVELFEEHGIGMPVIVSEDHVEHGKVNVFPRTVIGTKAAPVERWTKASSWFASWREHDENYIDKMLERDLQLGKFQKFAGEDTKLEDLRKAIAPFYPALFTTYRLLSVQGSGQGVFSVGLNPIVRLANENDMFDETVSSKHVANFAISSSVVDRRRQPEIRIRQDNSVIRYQFLETFLRFADMKYVGTGRAGSLVEAVPMIFGEMQSSMDIGYMELTNFQRVFFIEEVDMVYRAYGNLLHAIYDIYSNLNTRNTTLAGNVGAGTISIIYWYDFLQDCDAFDDRFVRRRAPNAFLMGMMWQIDEVTSDRHMHMHFVEFLVALGAVVYMRQFWHEEEFADLIEEFFEDRLIPLLEEKGTQEHKDLVAEHGVGGQGGGLPGSSPRRGQMPMVMSSNELRKAFTVIFKMADEDGDGNLTLREFRNAFRNPKTVALLGGKNFKVEDFLHFFDTLDSDGNRVLTVEEAMMGFAAIRRLELTADRAKAFLNQLLLDADADGDGQISYEEFRGVMRRLATQRKLMRLALDPDTVMNAFDRMKSLKKEKFEPEAFIEAIMKLRAPKPIPRWKIVLKQIFQAGDRDRSGSLSKEEFRNVLKLEGTQAKFERIGMNKNVLEGLFDVLDQDGSNDLTEDELVEGFQKLLQTGAAAVRLSSAPRKESEMPGRSKQKNVKSEAADAFVAALGHDEGRPPSARQRKTLKFPQSLSPNQASRNSQNRRNFSSGRKTATGDLF